MFKTPIFIGTATALLALAGCGNSDPHNRQAVSGTVSIDGKPIPHGNIEFAPLDKQPTTVTLEIKDGKFGIDANGGLSPGEYLIRVQGMDGPPPPPGNTPGEVTGPQPKSIVPEKFNVKSQEKVKIVEGKNELTLPLQK